VSTWARPIRFDCDVCTDRQFVDTLNAQIRRGDDPVPYVEAAAEVEHFLACGCSGPLVLTADGCQVVRSAAGFAAPAPPPKETAG
jgi:hypothetical protein